MISGGKQIPCTALGLLDAFLSVAEGGISSLASRCLSCGTWVPQISILYDGKRWKVSFADGESELAEEYGPGQVDISETRVQYDKVRSLPVALTCTT